MRLKVHYTLPLLLSISLPGLGFFLSDNSPDENVSLLSQWTYTSFILYIIWQLLNLSWGIKKLYKQLLLIVLAISVFLFFIWLVPFIIGVKPGFTIELKELIRIVFVILIFLTIQYAMSSQKKIETLKLEKEQLSKENYKAQLQSLRNQIDPHFLFNSLNTLRSIVNQNHKGAEEFILNLSNFYRSTLNHTNNNTLSFSEEISFLTSYLHLMKTRNKDAVHIDMTDINSKYDDFRLPSFALQNVVENCFKHNSMSSKEPLNISIETTGDSYIEITNNIQKRLTNEVTSGQGLQLLKRRYDLLGITEGIIVFQDDKNFKVKLKLINS
jgi:sensor histidine kinase YesM